MVTTEAGQKRQKKKRGIAFSQMVSRNCLSYHVQTLFITKHNEVKVALNVIHSSS